MQPTHLDLFSGIGGFSIGFEAAGFRTIGFAEIDPFAAAVLKKRWPAIHNYGDVRNADHQRERLLLLGELSDPMRQGLERPKQQIMARAAGLQSTVNSARQDRRYTTPRICRASDGIPHRSHRIRTLGNAIDPKVAHLFATAILQELKPNSHD